MSTAPDSRSSPETPLGAEPQPPVMQPAAPVNGRAPVRLTRLRAGDHGRLVASRLAGGDGEMLRALGLAERSRFRVCKAGDPWILQVRGTRVGMSNAVADCLLVIPDRRADE